MKKSSFLCVLMVAALMSGCSKSELVTPSAGEAGEIVLRSSVTGVNAAPSRAAYEGTDLAANPLTALVLTSLTEDDYSSLYCKGTMTFTGSDATTYDKPLLSGSSDKFDDYTTVSSQGKAHYLTGLTPVDGWDDSDTDGTYELELTGKEDVMLATKVSTSYAAVYPGTGAPTYAELEFEHQLTLLKLKFIKEDGLNITLQSAKVTLANGSALKTKAVAKISQASQVVDFEDGTVTELPCYKYNTDDVLADAGYVLKTTDDAVYAYVLVPPVTVDGIANQNDYTFSITYMVDGEAVKTTTTVVGVDLYTDNGTSLLAAGSSRNYANEITFEVVKGTIKVKASVSDWSTGGSKKYDI